MRVGDMVMLIGWEDPMPPMGAIGVIVGPLQDGDFDVEFPAHPWPHAKSLDQTFWCVPPVWLMLIKPDDGWRSGREYWDNFTWESA